jgi:hypothetical protein
VAEDLAHRDVLIDDIVAGFLSHVEWITLPILLSLLTTDIVIFRRALRPLCGCPSMRFPRRSCHWCKPSTKHLTDFAWLSCSARVYRGCGPRTAYPPGDSENPHRYPSRSNSGRGFASRYRWYEPYREPAPGILPRRLYSTHQSGPICESSALRLPSSSHLWHWRNARASHPATPIDPYG